MSPPKPALFAASLSAIIPVSMTVRARALACLLPLVEALDLEGERPFVDGEQLGLRRGARADGRRGLSRLTSEAPCLTVRARGNEPVKVRVYAPPLADPAAIDADGFVELPDGATLGELLSLLRVPLRPLAALFCMVNWRRAALRATLRDGDTVGFVGLLPGG